MKALVGAFNQEKALVGAFSVITNLRMELFQALLLVHPAQPPGPGGDRGLVAEAGGGRAQDQGEDDQGGQPHDRIPASALQEPQEFLQICPPRCAEADKRKYGVRCQ